MIKSLGQQDFIKNYRTVYPMMGEILHDILTCVLKVQCRPISFFVCVDTTTKHNIVFLHFIYHIIYMCLQLFQKTQHF